MKYDDVKVGMWLRNIPADLICEVTYRGPYEWSVEYADGVRHGYPPYQAKAFEPDVTGELAHHPAVQKHGSGVSSAELADFTSTLSQLAHSRILTVGHEQYGTTARQRFENLSAADLAREMLEEAADAINYLAMASIRMLALANATEEE